MLKESCESSREHAALYFCRKKYIGYNETKIKFKGDVSNVKF